MIADVACRACGEQHRAVRLQDPPSYANLAGRYVVFTCRTFGAQAVARVGDVTNLRAVAEPEAGNILPSP